MHGYATTLVNATRAHTPGVRTAATPQPARAAQPHANRAATLKNVAMMGVVDRVVVALRVVAATQVVFASKHVPLAATEKTAEMTDAEAPAAPVAQEKAALKVNARPQHVSRSAKARSAVMMGVAAPAARVRPENFAISLEPVSMSPYASLHAPIRCAAMMDVEEPVAYAVKKKNALMEPAYRAPQLAAVGSLRMVPVTGINSRSVMSPEQ